MSKKPAYESPEEALQDLREAEGSTPEGDLSPETIIVDCDRDLILKRKCTLVPYQRKDGRVGWVGTTCGKECKFP